MKKGTDTGIRCLLQGCVGTYEHRKILHCVERANEVVCIDHVPALVCDVCGDVQFEAETVRRLQALLDKCGKPDKHLLTYVSTAQFRQPVPYPLIVPNESSAIYALS